MGSGGIPPLGPPVQQRTLRLRHQVDLSLLFANMLAHALQRLALFPDMERGVLKQSSVTIERLGPVSSTHCCAYTPGLSTWSSSTALKRNLVLRLVSRLDAFSGYLFRT